MPINEEINLVYNQETGSLTGDLSKSHYDTFVPFMTEKLGYSKGYSTTLKKALYYLNGWVHLDKDNYMHRFKEKALDFEKKWFHERK